MQELFTSYPKFSTFAQEISKLDLENPDDYAYNNRADIYERLRLPMKMFNGSKKEIINNIVKQYFNLDDFLFSIIRSDSVSQIHTDTHYKKDSSLQRYCNLAFPIQGNFDNRITFWPNLDKQDSLFCFKNSFVPDSSLPKYKDKETWNGYIIHKPFCPVLLNTSVAHAASGNGSTLFAYITLIGKSYKDCIALYDEISNSATI